MDASTISRVTPFLECLRPEVRELPRYNSGLSIEYVREHYGVTAVAKLGSNENPYGPSPRVQRAIADAAADVALYPEPGCDALRAALSARLQVAPERLIFGNGSEDLIAVAAHTFLAPGKRVVTFAPSFGLHVIWPRSAGAAMHAVPVNADYLMDGEAIAAALRAETRMLIFGNPSNPVGTSITAQDLRLILSRISAQTLLVFDEAYLEYAATDPGYPDFLSILETAQTPWLMLRTFSKAYGLAGLRVGYAIASDPALIALMDRVRAPFNVNRLAQVAALAALQDMDYVRGVAERTVSERERVRAVLTSRGYRTSPSRANFLFVQAREDSGELSRRLLTKGVIVKPWQEPGYEDHLRVSIGSPEDNGRFLDAWKALAR